jgi:hypothetical protein
VFTNSTKIVEIIITPHVDEEQHPIYLDEAYFKLDKDGHYIIDHLVIPNVQCVKEKTNPLDYEVRYACDGKKFYKIIGNLDTDCDLIEILESEAKKTTVSKSS